MYKKKIVEKAREKISSEKAESSGQKSLLGNILDTVIDIVGDSNENQSARDSDKGKTSGRKPRAQNNGKVASVGRSVADQLRGRK